VGLLVPPRLVGGRMAPMRRPRLQFDLRTIFWATTLVGIAIVLGRWSSDQNNRVLSVIQSEISAGCLGAAVGSLFRRRSLGVIIGVLLLLPLGVIVLFLPNE
jgi:hypothetical protein